jgi:hypothetical protein
MSWELTFILFRNGKTIINGLEQFHLGSNLRSWLCGYWRVNKLCSNCVWPGRLCLCFQMNVNSCSIFPHLLGTQVVGKKGKKRSPQDGSIEQLHGKQYQPDVFKGLHISDVVRENDGLKVKVMSVTLISSQRAYESKIMCWLFAEIPHQWCCENYNSTHKLCRS